MDDAGRLATNCDDTRALVEHITSKWGVVVLLVLTEGTLRWSELMRRTNGAVDYSLSPEGESAAGVLAPLVGWAAGHAATTP